MQETGSSGTGAGRLRSLDGLRGVAALVVLFAHATGAVPALAAPSYEDGLTSEPGTPSWLLAFTPMKTLTAGTEAVYIFFVLSGLVLTLPLLHSARFSWVTYYPQRIARLYLPVIAAVLIGTALALLVARNNATGLGPWLAARPSDVTPGGFLRDVTLVGGVSGLISPLWSLQWEVLFSLALPAYVFGAVTLRRAWPVKVAGILAVILVGALAHKPYLVYLPMFALGVIAAVELDRLRKATARISGRAWTALTVVAFVLLTARWSIVNATSADSVLAAATVVEFIGAALIVLIAAFSPTAARLLEARACQWLGTVSFSLYLVHEPIVIAIAFLLGPGNGWLVLPIAVPVGLAAGALFFRCVEGPGHDVAKRIGRRLASRV